MKKLLASLTLVAFLAVSGLAYAQAGGGSTDTKKEPTKTAESGKKATKTKKGHKGGKKGKKGSGTTTTTPPPK
jgi:Ni/Co efflux regulator RcnB